MPFQFTIAFLSALLTVNRVHCQANNTSSPPSTTTHGSNSQESAIASLSSDLTFPQMCGLEPMATIAEPVSQLPRRKLLPANSYQFPWLAIIGKEMNDSIDWYCSAAIIGNRFLLTSMSCLKTRFSNRLHVWAGAFQPPTSQQVGHQQRTVDSILVHPERRGHYLDVIIVVTDQPLKPMTTVQLACWETNSQPVTAFVMPYWGILESDSSVAQSENNHSQQAAEKTVKYPVVVGYSEHILTTSEKCTEYMSRISTTSLQTEENSFVCSKSEMEFYEKMCIGHRAGPLFLYNNENRQHTVVGVVSMGQACTSPDDPSLISLVNIESVSSWIKNITATH